LCWRAYRVVYSVLRAYVIARLAPPRPMRLALLSGWLVVLVTLIGAIATWNRGLQFGPHWYPVTLVMAARPSAWLGAKLCECVNRPARHSARRFL
jgi:hypothetical protein